MKTLKLLILQGLPASGKTTWAKEFLNEGDNSESWIRVNRDEFRRMMGKYWVESRENFISSAEKWIVGNSFIDGYNVIVDATNLNPKTIAKWEELVFYYNTLLEKVTSITIEFKFFNVTPEEAIKRDSTRGEESVGERVILDFWKKYIKDKKDLDVYKRIYTKQSTKLPQAIIVDLDGTVALMNGRSPYDYSKVKTDLPNEPVINIVQRYALNGTTILFVSGRSNTCYDDTRQWIINYIWNIPELNNVLFDLYMRDSKDWRKDVIIKEEIYNKYIKDQYNILFVLDDRNQVVNYWRSQGLLCLQVYNGDF